MVADESFIIRNQSKEIIRLNKMISGLEKLLKKEREQLSRLQKVNKNQRTYIKRCHELLTRLNKGQPDVNRLLSLLEAEFN